MADFLPAPTYADVILVDPVTGRAAFNPIWLSWFLAVVQLINSSGGGGGAFNHNDLSGLQGGNATERFHLNSANSTVLSGDPGADRIIFFDDSAGSLAYLTPGSGLAITGTTIAVAGSIVVDSVETLVLSLSDGISAFTLNVILGEVLAADKTLTIIVNAGNRVITLDGNVTLNQDVATTSSPTFVDVIASNSFLPNAPDGASLGTNVSFFSDLFLADGAVIDWGNGDTVLTQGVDLLTLTGGDFAVAEHVTHTGTSPTITSGGGTSPSISGKDQAFTVTIGTGGVATTFTVTFANAFTNAPVGVANSDTDIVALKVATTTTTVVVTATAPFTASSKVHVIVGSWE